MQNFDGCDKTSFEGNVLKTIFSQVGLHQLINNPTHISYTYFSCVDLSFTSRPSLVLESGVHSSLHPSCHHQVIFVKFNLKIHYPPSYYRQVWHYQEGNTKLIIPAIDLFDWKKAFENTSIDEKVAIVNKTSLNILHDFIPHETLLADEKYRLCLTKKIKNLINEENTNKLEPLQNLLTKSIAEFKRKYYSRMGDKLQNTQKSSETYWPLLKKFLDNKKIPLILPISHYKEFVTNFKKKKKKKKSCNFPLSSLQNSVL